MLNDRSWQQEGRWARSWVLLASLLVGLGCQQADREQSQNTTPQTRPQAQQAADTSADSETDRDGPFFVRLRAGTQAAQLAREYRLQPKSFSTGAVSGFTVYLAPKQRERLTADQRVVRLSRRVDPDRPQQQPIRGVDTAGNAGADTVGNFFVRLRSGIRPEVITDRYDISPRDVVSGIRPAFYGPLTRWQKQQLQQDPLVESLAIEVESGPTSSGPIRGVPVDTPQNR